MSDLLTAAKAALEALEGPFHLSEQDRDALRTAIVEAEKVEPVASIPDILFDGFTVVKCLTKDASKRTSAENVSDVLDAVVRFMEANPAPAPKGEPK